MGEGALSRCVGDPQRFFADAWEQRVDLHAGGATADLLSLDDVDHLLSDTALRAPAFRVVKDGSPIPTQQYLRRARVGSRQIDDLIDPGRVHALFAGGATVVLQGLQRYWPTLTQFCRELERALDHPVQANAYLTPPDAAGLDVHCDAHDVFALQTFGQKRWVAWPRFAATDALPEPTLDRTLVEGDVLYVPRDTPHLVRTVDTASLHITIGIRVVTRRDILRAMVDQALEDPSLGAALPPGWTSDQHAVAADLVEEMARVAVRMAEGDPASFVAEEAERFWANRQPSLHGQLRELLTLDAVDDHTTVRRRAGTYALVREHGATAELVLGDRRVRFPGRVGKALRWVVESDELRVGDLAEHLNADGRRVLVRRLIAEGLLVRSG